MVGDNLVGKLSDDFAVGTGSLSFTVHIGVSCKEWKKNLEA